MRWAGARAALAAEEAHFVFPPSALDEELSVTSADNVLLSAQLTTFMKNDKRAAEIEMLVSMCRNYERLSALNDVVVAVAQEPTSTDLEWITVFTEDADVVLSADVALESEFADMNITTVPMFRSMTVAKELESAQIARRVRLKI